MKGRRLVWWLALGSCLLLVAAVAASGGARRRLQLVGLVAAGEIQDISWKELLRMLPPRSGYDVERLLAFRNPHAAIRNPYSQPSDVTAGAEAFRGRCALCHGGDGRGALGPDLTKAQFKHGASDWALFRTITHGVPSTAMQPQPMPAGTAWQLVAYVRSIGQGEHVGVSARGAMPPPTASPADPAILAVLARPTEGVGGGVEAAPLPAAVTYQRLRLAATDSASWLTYSGSYDGHRYSRLAQINRRTVAGLIPLWGVPVETNDKVETSPLVIGTTMYVTTPPSNARALDARTGKTLWSYLRETPNDLKFCCGRQNRGLAVLGQTVFLGTMDAHLVALDASTGKLLWETEVANYERGYSITGAPLAVDGKIIVGVAGGEFGIRGFLDAYDPGTGRRLWRFYTIPAPGEPGHETWGGDSWEHGGAPTWMTGTYDPDLKLLYWGVGNPGPDFQGEARPGDNLYSNSVVALDVDTGRLRWHYQFTPHDEHDWDATEIPVLADLVIAGKPRKLLIEANRNGFYYVLDRATGEFIAARAYVYQTWADGIDSAGRPLIRPGMSPSHRGTQLFPGTAGGTNWWSPSYDAASGRYFVQVREGGGVYFNSELPRLGDGPYLGSTTQVLTDAPDFMAVRALDAATGKLLWEYRPPRSNIFAGTGGVLSTAGGLVFTASEATFYALDALNGDVAWKMTAGADIRAAPITYLVDGRQQVTIATDGAILTFALDERP